MLNTNNYSEQIAYIDYTALPENLQKGYDFVKKSTQTYTNWDVYYKSEKIKEVIDLYFSKVASYVKHKAEPKILVLKPTIDKIKSAKKAIPKTKESKKEKGVTTSTKANFAEPNIACSANL